jgi:hypothetical protein
MAKKMLGIAKVEICQTFFKETRIHTLTLAARNKEPHPKLTKQVKVQVTGIQ